MRANLSLKLGLSFLFGSAILSTFYPAALAQSRTIIRHTSSNEDLERLEPRTTYEEHEKRDVIVKLIVRGDEWANVYVDGRRIFSPRVTRRSREFIFEEGVYDIRVTSADLFEVWAEGYLEVDRKDGRNIILSFSETGRVRVSGDSDRWIPTSDGRYRSLHEFLNIR